MTADEFRAIALKMPGAIEASHVNHPDFRAGKTIFATLGYPSADYGMVKLKPEQQEMLLAAEPQAFSAAKGAWGRRGSTLVSLRMLDSKTATRAIRMAWMNVAT